MCGSSGAGCFRAPRLSVCWPVIVAVAFRGMLAAGDALRGELTRVGASVSRCRLAVSGRVRGGRGRLCGVSGA